VPTFARRPFTRWFRSRTAPAPAARRPVVLWPDTFNNYFRPATAVAATEVLEAAGWEVRIPGRPLCCGRPLYDYGMLDLAQRYLRRTLRALAPEIAAGTPVVGLEPSCVAVFRDEMPDLLAHDRDAVRLSRQVVTLAELLTAPDAGFNPPRLAPGARPAALPTLAVMGFDTDPGSSPRWGRDRRTGQRLLRDGGSFGYEQGEHYDVSMRCGERVILPAVRRADPDTLIVADGFSCREQIEQATGRPTLHLAEVLRMASPPAVPDAVGREGPRAHEHPPLRRKGHDVPMSWTAPLARPLISGMFVAGGWDALRNPAGKVDRADKVLPVLADAAGLSIDSETVVRANGAVMVVGGLMLGAGIAPRLSAAVLAASLVPTTAAGHRFWELPPGPDRTAQRLHFLKNASMLGGLLFGRARRTSNPVWRLGRVAWVAVRAGRRPPAGA